MKYEVEKMFGCCSRLTACKVGLLQKIGFSTSNNVKGPKVALVLSGCGVYDGSEIHETSACLIHLTRGGAELAMFAPDSPQSHVIDHTKGERSSGEKRNVLVESARIARGDIKPLIDLQAASFDAVIFPGGFGVAKNLSNFAVDGSNCTVNEQVVKILKDFHASKKPMAFCCIAPILAAKIIPKVEVTLGQDRDDGSGKWPYCGSVEAIKGWGAVHHNRNVDGVVVDKKNLVVTSPAFMYHTKRYYEIYDGIGTMIKELLNLIK